MLFIELRYIKIHKSKMVISIKTLTKKTKKAEKFEVCTKN